MGKTKKTNVAVGIVGGRNFDDYELMVRKMSMVAAKAKKKGMNITAVVTGDALGTDAMAVRWAKGMQLPYTVHVAEWGTYGKSAGYKRNVKVVDDADIVVAFWDRKSKGTKLTIDIANKVEKPLIIVYIDAE